MITIIILCFAALTFSSSNDSCTMWQSYIYMNKDIYNMQSIIQNNTDLLINQFQISIYFQLISYASTPCQAYKNYYAVVFDKLLNTCVPLTQGALSCDNISGERNAELDSYNLSLAYPPNGKYSLTIKTISTNSTEHFSFSKEGDAYTITIESPSVYPSIANIQSFWAYFSIYKVGFALMFWILGLALVVLGAKLYGPILGIIGFISTELVVNILVNQYILPYNALRWQIFTVLGLASVVAIIVGWLCIRYKFYGLFLMGSLFGLIIGLVLYSAVLFLASQGRSWVLILLEVVLGLGCGVTMYIMKANGIIISTSFIGSYMIIRACSWFIGGYPNEMTLYEQLKNREFAGYWKFYIYLIVMLALTALGLITQCLLLSPDKELLNNMVDKEKEKQPLLVNYFHLRGKANQKNTV